MHEVLVNRLGGLSLPRKSVVRLTDRPDMTLDVYRGRKTTTQQHQILRRHFDLCRPPYDDNVLYPVHSRRTQIDFLLYRKVLPILTCYTLSNPETGEAVVMPVKRDCNAGERPIRSKILIATPIPGKKIFVSFVL